MIVERLFLSHGNGHSVSFLGEKGKQSFQDNKKRAVAEKMEYSYAYLNQLYIL